MNQYAISLPTLSPAIPLTYTVPGTEQIAAPLALALMELGMITDADLQPANRKLMDVFAGHDEKRLVELALTRWWSDLTSRLTFFKWGLHVQTISMYQDCPDPWFCIEQIGDIPHLTLARRVGTLEAELQGFGQTVMAVLEDAFRYLPEAFTPWKVFGLAQYHYWNGEVDEESWIESEIAFGEYKTREELLENVGVYKRADFFSNMPEWLPNPQRLCSRKELECAASSALGKQVIEACDRIWSVVTHPQFALEPYDVGVHGLQTDTVSGCVLLRWTEADDTIRVLDDAMNDFYNAGEYCEFISAHQVAPTAKALRKFSHQMDNMIELAWRVEQLLQLVGTESMEAPQ